MPEIRAVAFDVGNVLIDWIPEALVEPLAAATCLAGDRAMAAVFTLYARSKRRLDLGDLAPREFHAELCEIVEAAGGRKVAFDEFLGLWCTSLRPRPGAVALVARLRPEIAIAVWSNTDSIHFARYAPWLPFLSRARSLYLSFLAGVPKPEPAFFEGALAALGRAPGEVLFVDDSPANVEAARDLGLHAVQVATLDDLEGALEARGLLRR